VEEEEGGAHSGPLLRFVNALSAEIEKKHPDKLIDTLAYQYTEDPPAKVRPRPNVRVRLCPIAACEAHPYGQCPYDAYFVKNLRAWSKITDRLYVWHYNTNFAHYLLPFPDFDELIADIPMYKQHGVVGLFMEGGVTQGGGAENAELRSYVMAKLLWDVKADANKLIDEFLDGYYGKAAKPMRAYFDLMQRQVRMAPDGMGKHIWIYDRPSAPYLSDEFLANARDLVTLKEAVREQAPRYAEIKAPTVVISGDVDKTVSTNIHSRPFAAAVRDAKLIVLPGVGHMIQNAAPDLVVSEIEAMIDKTARGTAAAAN